MKALSFRRTISLASIAAIAILESACVPVKELPVTAASLEDIYVLRSIPEQHAPGVGCATASIGFEPFPTNAERFFSFWSMGSRREDGKVIDAAQARVAELRGCLGATTELARQNFYAEIRLGELALIGKGECVALAIDFPQRGLYPVRCHLLLSGLPAPYVGGLLTTNTMTTGARFGGDSQPPGYTQASIATIRLWKQPANRTSGAQHERTTP
jgi:hypothetical protein